ncbi:MAG: D-aminoacyl-tRNA deacylase [Candidatus Bathyarchaeia archaeon]
MGNKGITLSTSDPAGETILEVLKDVGFEQIDESVLKLNHIYLFVIDPLIVPEERYTVPKQPDPYPADFDRISEEYDIDYFVVASRHWSSSGKPCLTVHPTGNFGKAMYGGHPRELQQTIANPMRNIFLELADDPPSGYDVSLEATHHSPTQFETPMFFAEVGSREREWRNRETCEYLVKSILRGMDSEKKAPVAIGFGGGHYCPTFTSMEEEMAFGHIAAKYNLDLLTEDLIDQMIRKTSEDVSHAVLDSVKGYQQKKIEVTLRKAGIPIKD